MTGSGDLARVEISSVPGAVVVSIAGEIDISNAVGLRETIDAGCGGVESVICDLSSVDYADSAGVAMLLGLHRDLTKREVELVVVAPPRSAAATILQLAPLPSVTIVSALAEAMAVAEQADGQTSR